MVGLLLHGGGGEGGWGGEVIACGSVSNPMVFTVFSTPADCSCMLVFRADPCWNVSICIGFGASRSEQHGIYGVIACFQKAFFRAGPILWLLHHYLHLLTAPARCVYFCFCASRAEKHGFYGVLAGFQKAIFPPGHLSSATLFSCPVSACYFDNVGWAGGGGFMCGTNTQGIALPADLHSA